jgi:tetratricopeptide (TPR) repeat protein
MVAMRAVALLVALLMALSACAQTPKGKLPGLEKAYVAAKSAYQKKPADKIKKGAYVKATLAYANGVMYAAELAPRAKYPRALKLYREVLRSDPKNKVARDSRDTIERIYKSMGRPVPKG